MQSVPGTISVSVTCVCINYFRKGKLNVPLLYFHRYLRLTPALAANILFYSTLWKYLVVGPVSQQFRWDEMCDSYWWSALLYVQNYVNPASIVSVPNIGKPNFNKFNFHCCRKNVFCHFSALATLGICQLTCNVSFCRRCSSIHCGDGEPNSSGSCR